MINTIFEWIKKYPAESALILAFITIILSLGVLAWSAFRYVSFRRAEMSQERFENYHKLIDWLVYGREEGVLKLDSQIACVYELRNFRTYKGVSIRILEGLKNSWSNGDGATKNERILKEIDITLKHLKSYSFFC